MNLRPLFAVLLLIVSACSGLPPGEIPARNTPLPLDLPPMLSFANAPFKAGVAKANADIARDFLELAFEMESGRQIERMTRFDGPVTVALNEDGPPAFEADLDLLVARLRREAGIDIRRVKTGTPANIIIDTLPRKQLQSIVPQAACFVVPRVSDWDSFKKNRRAGLLDWATLKRRELAAVFIPSDVAPQEARDCLHEEIAQALGPLNDIYRLPDSVFNDDNFNTVLSPFDMLILRIYYSDTLKNGMTRDQARAALPGLLAKLNPGGESRASDGLQKSPRPWITAIESSLGPRGNFAHRLGNARRAVKIADANDWQDNRLGFSLFALGRLALATNPGLASDSFIRAYDIYSRNFGFDDIHTAHVALQLAAFSLSAGNTETALGLINKSLPVANRAQNASLLATLLMIKAAALEFNGQSQQALTVRRDALGWAQYGFQSDAEIAQRLQEIAALRPPKRPGV